MERGPHELGGTPGGGDPVGGNPVGGGPSDADRNWAMVVHVGTLASLFFGGWGVNIVVPLVGYLWKRSSRKPFRT